MKVFFFLVYDSSETFERRLKVALLVKYLSQGGMRRPRDVGGRECLFQTVLQQCCFLKVFFLRCIIRAPSLA